MRKVFEQPVAISPTDIDSYGHINNVTYVRWLQEAAIAHSAALGWNAAAYHALGQGWVVRRHQIEYLRPAFPKDVIVVRTWVANVRKVTSQRHYHVLRASDGLLLAQAQTDWAFIDFQTAQPTRIAAAVVASFAPMVITEGEDLGSLNIRLA